jgi:hypothetical protein
VQHGAGVAHPLQRPALILVHRPPGRRLTVDIGLSRGAEGGQA